MGNEKIESPHLSDQLLRKYTEHIRLAKLVRLADSTFEVDFYGLIFFVLGLHFCDDRYEYPDYDIRFD